MFSTHTKAPTVTSALWWGVGWHQALTVVVMSRSPWQFGAHWKTFHRCQCPSVWVWALQRPPTCWPMNVKNLSHIHSGNYCPGCISRFKKITDNKSSAFPLCVRWYLHFPFSLIHFILWFISHAEAKLFKIQKTWQFPAVIKGLQLNCYLSLQIAEDEQPSFVN